jgi:hypothetical protein
MASQGEGTIPFTFQAHQSEDGDSDVGPFQMWLFDHNGIQASAAYAATAGTVFAPKD